MLPKLIVITVAAGATACALLVNRQHRIDTAHDIAVLHQRLIQQEQALWRLRSDIADRTRPNNIRERAESLNFHWVAIPAVPRFHQDNARIAHASHEPSTIDDLSDHLALATGR